MGLLLLLRSQVAAQAPLVSGGDYTVTVNYDKTSGHVTGLSWTTSTGPLTVAIKSANAGTWQLSGLPPGPGSAAAPAGHFVDQTFEAYTEWNPG